MKIDDLLPNIILSSVSNELDKANIPDYDSMKELVEKIKIGLDDLLKKKREKLGIYRIKISYDQYHEGQYDLSPWEHEEEIKTYMSLKDFFSDIKNNYSFNAIDLLTNEIMLDHLKEEFETINREIESEVINIEDYGGNDDDDENVNILTTMEHLNHILSKDSHKLGQISCDKCKVALKNFIREIETPDYEETISLEFFSKVIKHYMIDDSHKNVKIKLI